MIWIFLITFGIFTVLYAIERISIWRDK